MLFVLDSSIALAWYLPAQADDYARAVYRRLGRGDDQIAVPEVFAVEVAHNIIKAVRNRKMSEREARAELTELDALPIEIRPLGLTAGELLSVAQDWRVSALDAFYLSLASGLGVPLASRDGHMNEAAARLGIPLFTP
ncbi:MAG: type II toxin-antitoxin system VapC family toxin [Burkholderiales bacterium]